MADSQESDVSEYPSRDNVPLGLVHRRNPAEKERQVPQWLSLGECSIKTVQST